MDTSRQDVLEDALLALLQAEPTLAALEVPPHYGEPQTPMQVEIWIYETSEVEHETSLTGGSAPEIEETVTIRVAIFNARGGDDTQASRDAGTALQAIVEELVRSNPHLGLSAQECYYAQVTRVRRQVGTWGDSHGWLREVTIEATDYLRGSA